MKDDWPFSLLIQLFIIPHSAGVSFRLKFSISSGQLSSVDWAFQFPKVITVISSQIVNQNPQSILMLYLEDFSVCLYSEL